MSGNFGNSYRRNLSPAYQFKPNGTSRSSTAPATPVVYSQPHIMRNQMSESEPLSEYTEVPLTRSIPASFRQMAPEVSPRQMVVQSSFHPMTPHGSRVMEMQPMMAVRSSPYNRPIQPQLLPAPTPQCFIAVPTSNMKKTLNSTSAVAKANSSSARSTSQGPKMSSVTRKRFLIGSVDQVVRWHKMAKEAQLYITYQVPAILESITYGQNGVSRLILRSDQKNNTLPLQAIFYPIDRELPKLKCGTLIMCAGRMVGTNKLQVFDMWSIEPDSLAGLKRISFLCQRTLQEALLATPEP